ncbi:MAG: hypothetical protein AABY04_03395, partial [Candidatus Micrarchaeota archaeon]
MISESENLKLVQQVVQDAIKANGQDLNAILQSANQQTNAIIHQISESASQQSQQILQQMIQHSQQLITIGVKTAEDYIGVMPDMASANAVTSPSLVSLRRPRNFIPRTPPMFHMNERHCHPTVDIISPYSLTKTRKRRALSTSTDYEDRISISSKTSTISNLEMHVPKSAHPIHIVHANIKNMTSDITNLNTHYPEDISVQKLVTMMHDTMTICNDLSDSVVHENKCIARCTSVLDGDTIVINNALFKNVHVRLSRIDTPEMKRGMS